MAAGLPAALRAFASWLETCLAADVSREVTTVVQGYLLLGQHPSGAPLLQRVAGADPQLPGGALLWEMQLKHLQVSCSDTIVQDAAC